MKCMILRGALNKGFQFVGPFDEVKQANRFANTEFDDDDYSIVFIRTGDEWSAEFGLKKKEALDDQRYQAS